MRKDVKDMPARLRRLTRQDRFEKFTERARHVLALAQEEAQRFRHNYIGTEHLLLGLIREGEGIAARVLRNMGVDLADVRQAVEKIIGRGEHFVVGEIGLTPRAKKVIELAVMEARNLDHHYVGTEHLLLGLIREGEGIAAGVLENLGIKLERVRREVLAELGRSPARGSINKPPPVALLATIAGAIVALVLLARRRKTF
jgi:ATP-dependent Clp protease ATP-binding subunit ClpC